MTSDGLDRQCPPAGLCNLRLLAHGKATSVTDANGNRAEMSWDGLDRQKRWIFPSKTAPGTVNPADYEEYGYDSNANRTSLRKRDGVRLDYTYDALLNQSQIDANVAGAAQGSTDTWCSDSGKC